MIRNHSGVAERFLIIYNLQTMYRGYIQGYVVPISQLTSDRKHTLFMNVIGNNFLVFHMVASILADKFFRTSHSTENQMLDTIRLGSIDDSFSLKQHTLPATTISLKFTQLAAFRGRRMSNSVLNDELGVKSSCHQPTLHNCGSVCAYLH